MQSLTTYESKISDWKDNLMKGVGKNIGSTLFCYIKWYMTYFFTILVDLMARQMRKIWKQVYFVGI